MLLLISNHIIPAGRMIQIKRNGRTKKSLTKLIDSRINKRLEIKVFENASGALIVDGSADITLGTIEVVTQFDNRALGMSEGTGDNERVGTEVELVAMKNRMTIHQSDTVARLIYVYFPNGIGTGFESSFNSAVGNGNLFNFLPRKEEFQEGYRVLHDKLYRFDSSEQVPNIYRINLPVKNLKVKWNDAGTLVAGKIKMYILTNQASRGGVVGDFAQTTKTLYRDS